MIPQMGLYFYCGCKHAIVESFQECYNCHGSEMLTYTSKGPKRSLFIHGSAVELSPWAGNAYPTQHAFVVSACSFPIIFLAEEGDSDGQMKWGSVEPASWDLGTPGGATSSPRQATALKRFSLESSLNNFNSPNPHWEVDGWTSNSKHPTTAA